LNPGRKQSGEIMDKTSRVSLNLFLILYSIAWAAALPFLFFIRGLGPFSWQRLGLKLPRGPFDLWIQASSVGEAKLALKILSDLPENSLAGIIISSNTIQGMNILKDGVGDRAKLFFFPFDILPVWFIALKRIKPARLLLLETEIWPALLFSCRKKSIPVIIGNARMSLKSFCRYLPLSGLLNRLGPDRVLAVSDRDKDRFSWIFKNSHVQNMFNIKFDIIEDTGPIPYTKNPLSAYFKAGHPLVVLGSVRREEEPRIKRLIAMILSRHPRTTIALFPRHMNRIRSWTDFFDLNDIPWTKRSGLEVGGRLPPVIIWDRFGELLPAYALAGSVFVGGSLAPCGGQNFLEPLSQGIVPCMGPFRDNFNWVGNEILSLNLLCQVQNEQELYQSLTKPASASRQKVLIEFTRYVNSRKGGTKVLINSLDSFHSRS
jgi:3-deoxy-D-manno-octulosonic-acid transferase